MMPAEKETYSSDTLERSNLSSLQSDNSSTNRSFQLNHQNTNLNENKNCFCQPRALDDVKLVPCPVLNSNFNPNQSPQCYCQKVNQNGHGVEKQNRYGSPPNDWQNFNWKWPRHNYSNKKEKSYEIKPKNKRYPHLDKSYACCEKLEGIPRRKNFDVQSIVENPMKHWSPRNKNDVSEKIEIYYFDHGNSAYYHTTDVAPILQTEKFAEKSNSAATKFWAEIFGYVHIVTSFLTAFFLQLLRYLLFSLIRPLTVGVIQIVADYFIKPVLSIMFNGIIQPILILFYNVVTSLRDCCEPLAAALGFFIKEVALLFRSCRLIEITHHHNIIKQNDNT